MTVTLDLPSDIEAALRRRADALGQDVESLLRQVVRESVEADQPRSGPGSRDRNLRQRLEAWTALHPRVGRPVDDSRESIYAGRGE